MIVEDWQLSEYKTLPAYSSTADLVLALNANRLDIIAFTSILTSKRIMLVSDSIYHLSTAARLKDVIFLLKTKQITV